MVANLLQFVGKYITNCWLWQDKICDANYWYTWSTVYL